MNHDGVPGPPTAAAQQRWLTPRAAASSGAIDTSVVHHGK